MPFKSKSENNPHFRSCPNPKENPKCAKILYYSSKYALKYAIDNDKCCSSCSKYQIPRPLSVGIAVSMTRKGKPLSEEHKQKIRENIKPYIRTQKHREDQSRRNKQNPNPFSGRDQWGSNNCMFGRSLKTIWIEKYGEVEGLQKWNEYRLRLSRKSGFSINWDEIKNDYCDNLAKYRRLCNRYTNQEDLTMLYGHQFRGVGRKDNMAWHLDHIVPVVYGFRNNIDPKFIGGIENLRFVPWRLNIYNGDKLYSLDNYDSTKHWKCRVLLNKWGFGLPKLIKINKIISNEP